MGRGAGVYSRVLCGQRAFCLVCYTESARGGIWKGHLETSALERKEVESPACCCCYCRLAGVFSPESVALSKGKEIEISSSRVFIPLSLSYFYYLAKKKKKSICLSLSLTFIPTCIWAEISLSTRANQKERAALIESNGGASWLMLFLIYYIFENIDSKKPLWIFIGSLIRNCKKLYVSQ